MSQRDRWVDAHRAAGGDVARGERHGGKYCGDSGQRCEIVGRDAVEQPRHRAAHSQGERQSHQQTDECEPHSPADDQAKDFAMAFCLYCEEPTANMRVWVGELFHLILRSYE